MTGSDVISLAMEARQAALILQDYPDEQINEAIRTLSRLMLSEAGTLLAANQQDIQQAEQAKSPQALVDRLTLNASRLQSLALSVLEVSQMPAPAGRVLSAGQQPNGLFIEKVACPFGVIAMIYESRPNVTVDAAVLCLKSRNAVILRGGKEALHTSLAFYHLIAKALEIHHIHPGCVNLINSDQREKVSQLLKAEGYIDVIIPRGGRGLIEFVRDNTHIPVFSHLDGICHTYIHAAATPDMAIKVAVNAKARRPGICGAMETLLIDKRWPDEHTHALITALIAAGCIIKGDEQIMTIDPRILPADESDWGMEYLDMRLSCKMVESLDAAIEHINHFGSHHTDAIITADKSAAEKFMRCIDSGIVMHNVSSQFADGGEFGFGMEIGIATGKLHARGPVGLEQLCTYKYRVSGDGLIRD
ncbi:glutamate-5-semialdehyde dehydrogenase [Erwinia mallotivora]|uniref:glutamate-5-semialdehyde dehydrogenase n=1 Tax=Erwinia mallotivora TaxID=69222 RepID=UPI0021C17BC5|nr:glutamate-5-semialdehyde dehydrogenase [Erwinia mallotivora]